MIISGSLAWSYFFLSSGAGTAIKVRGAGAAASFIAKIYQPSPKMRTALSTGFCRDCIFFRRRQR
jgi:hypothetical protein